jgi:hypothetical protein
LYQSPGRGIPLNVSGPAQPAGVMAKRGLPQLLGLAVLLFEAVSAPAELGTIRLRRRLSVVPCATTIFWPRVGVRKPGGRARGVTARGMTCSAWAQMVADVAREINADSPYSRSAGSTASRIPLRATRHAGIAASITR